jgi:hypothetical protein
MRSGATARLLLWAEHAHQPPSQGAAAAAVRASLMGHIHRFRSSVTAVWHCAETPSATHGFAEHFSWQLATILQSPKSNKAFIIWQNTPSPRSTDATAAVQWHMPHRNMLTNQQVPGTMQTAMHAPRTLITCLAALHDTPALWLPAVQVRVGVQVLSVRPAYACCAPQQPGGCRSSGSSSSSSPHTMAMAAAAACASSTDFGIDMFARVLAQTIRNTYKTNKSALTGAAVRQ